MRGAQQFSLHSRTLLVAFATVALVATFFAAVTPAAASTPVTISGVVTDEQSHAPVSGAEVHVFNPGTGDQAVTTTAADGSYELTVTGGLLDFTISQAPGYEYFTHYEVPISSSMTGVNWQLVPLGEPITVSGQVIAEGYGIPVAGAQVSFNRPHHFPHVTTDGDGRFEVLLYTGTYQVTITASGYEPLVFEDYVFDLGSESFDQRLEPLGPPITVSGTVTAEVGGQPVEGVLVSLNSPAGTYHFEGTTNAAGFYSIDAFGATYDVRAGVPGYVPHVEDGVTFDQSTTHNIEITAVATTGTLTGRIDRTDTTAALGGARITVGGRSATSGSDGTFTITNVPAGLQAVTVSRTGFTTRTIQNFTVNAGLNNTVPPASSALSVAPLSWPRFSDVPSGQQFATQIRWLANQRITTGNADGTFGVKSPVTREAMAAFLYRFMERYDPTIRDFVPPPTSSFSDVPSGHQFYREITWLASTGITTGYAGGTFQPKSHVSREAMAAFLYRTAERIDHRAPDLLPVARPFVFTPPASSPFSDVPIDSQFYREIMWLRSTGITTGYAGRVFRPKSSVERQATAAFLFRFAE